MVENALINKYRPSEFKEVLGHAHVVTSLQAALKKGTSHAFLFVGPSGVGKTTLARLVAKTVGCLEPDRIEIDGARYTGVDEMREVMDGLIYAPLGEGAVKVVIVDECQLLSKNSWNSLLKMIEEPPEWVYWCFCTTEATKVPAAVKTRCLTYELKPVSYHDLGDWLDEIAVAEKLSIDDEIITLCAKEAQGSPRQALVNLAVCSEATDREQAYRLLQSVGEDGAAVDLARVLYKRPRWGEVHLVLEKLKDQNPESIRRVVLAYGAKMVLSPQGGKESFAGPVMEVLDAFSQPFYGMDALILACGRVAGMGS